MFATLVFHRNNVLRYLLISILLISGFTMSAQVKRSAEGFVEIDMSTQPYKRHIFQVDLLYGMKSDTGEVNAYKYPAYYGATFWYHYYPTRTIALAANVYYGHNFDISEIGQPQTNEIRTTLQSIFNVPSLRIYTSHRIAMDLRWIELDGDFTNKVRFRYRYKIIVPVNKRELVKGAVYVTFNEELFFSKVNNEYRNQFFEQSRTVMGIGYCIGNYMQIEPNYTLALYPLWGSGTYRIVNVFGARLTINNLLTPKKQK